MKVLKLNRRWKQYKEHGHTMCFRFDGWNQEATAVEKILRGLCETGGWIRDGEWYGYYGQARVYGDSRPYFITVRDENIVSAVLLKLDINE